MAEISQVTGGSSARGQFSVLFGLTGDEALPSEESSRLGAEAAQFLQLGGHPLTVATSELLQRLSELANPSGGDSIAQLTATWDTAVDGFLNGDNDSALPDDLRDWFDSYAGRGAGQVDGDAIPEPFLGPLAPNPKAVFLALNPGRAFAFQRRDGRFADRIRQLGSYTDWAATWPYVDGDWEAAGQPPNRHHQSRLRFLRRWLGQQDLPASAMLSFELYPWHSTRVTAAMKPDPSTIKRYVWDPIAELGRPLVFAFGADWFRNLEQLGFQKVAHLGRGGKNYGSTVTSRSVLVLEGPSGVTVIAEKHAGSAGPPNAAETLKLRDAVEAALANR